MNTLKSIDVSIDKLITLAKLGLGAERPLNKEKREWIKKLTKQKEPLDPILVSPIKDTGPVRTSGAGDTLAAVAIAALEKGLSTPQALELGVLASQNFMHRSDPETPLNWANLTAHSMIHYE